MLNTTGRNGTYLADRGPPLWDTIALGIIATLSLLGNGTVIYLICTRKNLHKTASPNWFVLSLAIADLCVGALYAPSRFLCIFAVTCNDMTWNIIVYFQSVFLTASVTNLCALTFDRYLAVVHPFTYRNSMLTSTKVYHLIHFAWWVALLSNVPFLVTEFMPNVNKESGRFFHTAAHMIIFAVIPSIFMIYAYLAIATVVRKHKNVIKRQRMELATNFSIEVTSHRNSYKYNDDTMKAVGIIVVVFILCSALYQWLTICTLGSCNMPLYGSPVHFVIFTLLHFKSAINFVVYALLRKDFQNEIRKIWKSCFCLRK